MKNPKLMASLHARHVTLKGLAERIGSSHTHVCEVLLNKPGHGYRTRKKLARWLLPSELALLGWDSEGRLCHVELPNSKKPATPILDRFRIPQ